MIIDEIVKLKEYTDLIVKTRKTPEQIFILLCVLKQDSISFSRYIDMLGKIDRKVIQNLIDEDFLIKTNSGGFSFSDLYIGPAFQVLEDTGINWEEIGEKFWDEFPNTMIINGRTISAKSTSKEGLIEKYLKKIKKNLETHSKIMSSTKTYKEENNGYATMGILKYIESEHYLRVTKENSNNLDKFGEL